MAITDDEPSFHERRDARPARGANPRPARVPMTSRQRIVLADVRHCYKYARQWYRARTSGERVTLASLWRAGALDRRPHRGREGDPNAAYEYAPRDARARYPSATVTPEMLDASKKEP